MAIEVRPVQLAFSGDSDGALIFRDGVLIAVLSRLGPHHEDLAGVWHVEAVFGGRNSIPPHQHFPDVAAACSYFERANG
jgi:hypothetical protein